MIFKALACDFDGTLASEDRIGPEALEALGHAREAGLRLILVTGRTFFELTRVCERLDLFDAVVAENGAVLYYPAAAMIRDQGPPPTKRLLAELDRRGISYQVGRVIIATRRAEEAGVRGALRLAGVDRDLVYNRAALMLLPPSVSKGTGIRQALRFLSISHHDMLAFGDAENDLDLFQAGGWTACPANAVAELKERADWTFPGEDGVGVAAAIMGPVLGDRLPVARSPRHRLTLGWVVETSEPVTISARGINVLIHGDPLSGKSWMAGALVERLVGSRYATCAIDPEGDYRVLGRMAGVTWAEIDSDASMADSLSLFERDPSVSVVVDLSALPHTRKLTVIEHGLRVIRDLRRRLGRPHWVLLDEAHYSLHPDGVPDEAAGIEDRGFCLVSYRPSWLRPSVVKSLDVFLLARATAEEELAFLRSCLPGGAASRVLASVSKLPPGEFLVVQPEGAGAALTFIPAPRETTHVRHLRKYADVEVPFSERFLFRRPDGAVVATAQSLREFRHAVGAVDDAVLAHHAGRGDFSRWVREVFSDLELARQLRKSEARWRRGELPDLRRAIEHPVAYRYGPEP
ncbi:MAG TPA: HAD hydrolase family protein [Methylomirabilota bacterium]|nr:HAD hydrolase family protein [Methylomirabilota bacterium]